MIWTSLSRDMPPISKAYSGNKMDTKLMFEVTITGDTADDIRRKMEEFIGKHDTTTPRSAWEVVNAADLQELLMAIDARLYAEGYEVIKKKKRFLEKRTAEVQP